MDERNIKKPYSDRRWYDDPQAKSPICNRCKHLIGLMDEVIKCDAFLNGIPRKWLLYCDGERSLEEECNNGIKFERK